MKTVFQRLTEARRRRKLGETIALGVVRRAGMLHLESYRLRTRSVRREAFRATERVFPSKDLLVRKLRWVLGWPLPEGHRAGPVGDEEELVRRAEGILRREFDILGSGPVKLDPIDWHVDFKSGFRWAPGRFYRDYQQVCLTDEADVKVPRELSRCHHFLVLGRAYQATGNNRYVHEYLRQTLEWIDSNPLMYSINWGCTMDVAIRAINWIWALGMMANSDVVTDDFTRRVAANLYEHGYYIYRNPEKGPVNNHNHYVSDLVGQVYLGLLFEGLEEPRQWLRDGADELFREMRSQILPSGPTYERTTNYHRLVLELFLSAVILLERSGREIPGDIRLRLEKMFEFVMFYLKPDGTAPVIGDQDDGRLHPFGLQANLDHRYLLSVGASLFERPDFKAASAGFGADALFLLGLDSRARFDGVPVSSSRPCSRPFTDAGFFVMRRDDNYLFISNSGKGRYSELSGGTHTHCDHLSFELYCGGRTFITDTGSYVYSADPDARMLFRSTRMHNTVVVDGKDQNVLRREVLWDFERNALPRHIRWSVGRDVDEYVGDHTGYERLDDPVRHQRSVRFDRRDPTWFIEDTLAGEGEHHFEWYFHFAPEVDFEIVGTEVSTICADGANINIQFESAYVFSVYREEGWVSWAYGRRVRASVLRVEMTATCPVLFKTTIRKV